MDNYINIKNHLLENMFNENFGILIVYPEEKMLEEIIERCKIRGNNEEFVSRVKEVY